jgi:hypothetical protein
MHMIRGLSQHHQLQCVERTAIVLIAAITRMCTSKLNCAALLLLHRVVV